MRTSNSSQTTKRGCITAHLEPAQAVHTWLFGVRAIVIGTVACGSVDAPLESEDVPLDVLPGQRIPVFSTCSHVCHKTRTPSAPLSSRTPAPRQQPVLSEVEGYPRHYSGPWLPSASLRTSLGASLPSALAGASLLRSCWRATDRLFRSVHPLCAALGRCFTPGPVSGAA
jgi:hypothetical protein